MSSAAAVRRATSRALLAALAFACAIVAIGVTAPPEAPFAISVHPVLLRIDDSERPPRPHAFSLDVDVRLWSIHLHVGWGGIPLANSTQEL